jgi:glyoxylase-like metal-dependent hydrolase (beta-lactamase superfamily II)
MRPYSFILSLLLLSFMPVAVFAHGHEGGKTPDGVSIHKLTEQIYMIQAGGGNIAISKGAQGIFMIDNGLSEDKEKVMKAVESISDGAVKILVNTHWHYDHAGNNQDFGEQGTMIIAHENVRKSLEKGGTIAAFNKVIEAADLSALPVVTYADNLSIHLNNSEAKIIKMAPSHTDGDSIIYWPNENIIHTGDLFFNGFFPFIDVSSGGNLRGVIDGMERVLSLSNEETKIIPGHGALATRADLESAQFMLKVVAARLKEYKGTDRSKEEWTKSDPLADMDKKWGNGFLSTTQFTDIAWDTY